MTNIGIIVENPSTTFDLDEYIGRGAWRLSFDAKLANAHQQKVSLVTKEGSLSEIGGTVSFDNADNSEPYKGFERGSLSYWKGQADPISPTPSSWLVTIRLPTDDYDALVRMVHSNVQLMSLNIQVDGVGYDWAPDGSMKAWDNETNPAVEIKGYRLFFGQREEEELVPDPPEAKVDTDVKALVSLRQIEKTLYYVIVGMVLLLGMLVFKH